MQRRMVGSSSSSFAVEGLRPMNMAAGFLELQVRESQ
jgi:hypothetical protein